MSTARLFNGTSDNLSNGTSYLASSGGPFTVMLWMKSSSLTQTNTYILQAVNTGGAPNQWGFLYGYVNDGSAHAQVEFYGPGTSLRTGSQITILNTNWHHVCYRYLGAASEWAFFLDGTKTVINATITATLQGPLALGLYVGAASGPANYCATSLAEVAFWSTNLTDANIAAIANTNGATLPSAFPTNLLGYWPLGLASPDTDQSAANHPLTVAGTSIVTGPYLAGGAGQRVAPWWPFQAA